MTDDPRAALEVLERVACELEEESGDIAQDAPRYKMAEWMLEMAAAIRSAAAGLSGSFAGPDTQPMTQEELADSWCPNCGRIGAGDKRQRPAVPPQLERQAGTEIWTCGCGTVNGVNLAHCRVCARSSKPEDQR